MCGTVHNVMRDKTATTIYYSTLYHKHQLISFPFIFIKWNKHDQITERKYWWKIIINEKRFLIWKSFKHLNLNCDFRCYASSNRREKWGLTYFWQMLLLNTPWKHQKTKGFQVFSVVMIWKHRLEMEKYWYLNENSNQCEILNYNISICKKFPLWATLIHSCFAIKFNIYIFSNCL